MKAQYTKDKNCRLSFRVNEPLYDWVGRRASLLGVSPCDFARQTLFQQMAAEQVLSTLGTNAEIARCSDEDRKKHK